MADKPRSIFYLPGECNSNLSVFPEAKATRGIRSFVCGIPQILRPEGECFAGELMIETPGRLRLTRGQVERYGGFTRERRLIQPMNSDSSCCSIREVTEA